MILKYSLGTSIIMSTLGAERKQKYASNKNEPAELSVSKN